MPKLWATNASQQVDLKEVTKWQINDMKETRERWAKEEAIKKAQTEKQTKASFSLKK